MAQAIFKVLKPVNYDGVDWIRGEQMILDTDVGQPMVELGQLDLTQYVDPTNESDAAQIADINAQVELKKLSGETAEEQITPDDQKLKDVEQAQEETEGGTVSTSDQEPAP